MASEKPTTGTKSVSYPETPDDSPAPSSPDRFTHWRELPASPAAPEKPQADVIDMTTTFDAPARMERARQEHEAEQATKAMEELASTPEFQAALKATVQPQPSAPPPAELDGQVETALAEVQSQISRHRMAGVAWPSWLSDIEAALRLVADLRQQAEAAATENIKLRAEFIRMDGMRRELVAERDELTKDLDAARRAKAEAEELVASCRKFHGHTLQDYLEMKQRADSAESRLAEAEKALGDARKALSESKSFINAAYNQGRCEALFGDGEDETKTRAVAYRASVAITDDKVNAAIATIAAALASVRAGQPKEGNQ